MKKWIASWRCIFTACGFQPLVSVVMNTSSVNGVFGGTCTVMRTSVSVLSLLVYFGFGGSSSGLPCGGDACTTYWRGICVMDVPCDKGLCENRTDVTMPLAVSI